MSATETIDFDLFKKIIDCHLPGCQVYESRREPAYVAESTTATIVFWYQDSSASVLHNASLHQVGAESDLASAIDLARQIDRR